MKAIYGGLDFLEQAIRQGRYLVHDRSIYFGGGASRNSDLAP